MFFRTKNSGERKAKGEVGVFGLGFVLLLLTFGLGWFPTQTEGLECYECYSWEACAIPRSYLRTTNCENGEYCKKVYGNGDTGLFKRACAPGSEHFNNSILFQCAEKFFGKEGEGACLDITPENLKIVEDCHWSKVGKDLKYPGFGYSKLVLGSWRYGAKSCFCKGDLCNGGPIPGIKETEEKSSGVECYSCSSKPNPSYGLTRKCDFQTPDDIQKKIWCPDQAHCFKRTGTQGPPWSFYPVEYIERGCSTEMVPDATIEETEKVIECLKKYGGCVSTKSEAGSECLKGFMNDTAVHPPPPAFDLTEINELCVCEGDLCNGEAPKPTEIVKVIPEPMSNNEENSVGDGKMVDSSSFTRWFVFVLLIMALVGFTCLIQMFQKRKIL